MKTKLIISACLLALLSGCYMQTPATGKKVGVIVKLAKAGIINDTWEGQIVRGGLNGGSGAFGGVPFDFTIEHFADLEKAQKLMESGTEVVLEYKSPGFGGSINTDSGHFLTAIYPAVTK